MTRTNPGATLKLDERDRGRLVLASVITLLTLPTIWLVNRDDAGESSSRPNVGAVGIDPGEADEASGTPVSELDPMGESGAMYLQPATTVLPPASIVVAIGTTPDDAIATARGTYRRSVEVNTCLFNGVRDGELVTVVNVANGRSTECNTTITEGLADGVLVMNISRFQRIADLTAAPIHLEIRQ